jgi:hypothetical protein
MFYRNEFVGNWEDIIYGDITEAKNYLELESLIKQIQQSLNVFNDSEKTPDIWKVTYQKRLEEVLDYYIKMGGNLVKE